MVAAYPFGWIASVLHPTTEQSYQNYIKDLFVRNRNMFRGIDYVG